jgi:hypothetical protein
MGVGGLEKEASLPVDDFEPLDPVEVAVVSSPDLSLPPAAIEVASLQVGQKTRLARALATNRIRSGQGRRIRLVLTTPRVKKVLRE